MTIDHHAKIKKRAYILFLRSQLYSTFRRSNFLGRKTTFPDTFLPPSSYSIMFLSE